MQFDEDEKPAAKSDGKESDDDGEVEEDLKDEKPNENDNHSDISENDSEPDSVSSDDEIEDGEKTDEKSSPTKNQKRSSKSLSPQKVKPEDHSDISEEEDENFGKDHNKGDPNTKSRYKLNSNYYQFPLKNRNFYTNDPFNTGTFYNVPPKFLHVTKSLQTSMDERPIWVYEFARIWISSRALFTR